MTDNASPIAGPSRSGRAPHVHRFRRSRPGRVGYRRSEVDRFAALLAEALGHDPPTMPPDEVATQRFRGVWLRPGYDMCDVDAWLDRSREELRRRRRGGPGDTQPPAVPRRHVATWWIYLVALLVVAAMVAFTVTQL